MPKPEARLRAELYLQQRVDYQDDYYERRIAEFTFNSDRMLWISAGLMGVSTVISSYSVMSDQPLYAFVTALLAHDCHGALGVPRPVPVAAAGAAL